MEIIHRCIYLANSPITTDLVSASGIFLDGRFFGGDADHSYGSPGTNNFISQYIIYSNGGPISYSYYVYDSYGHKNTGVKS